MTISEAKKVVPLPVQKDVLTRIQKIFIDNQPSEWLKIGINRN
jgi:hypothetical protein